MNDLFKNSASEMNLDIGNFQNLAYRDLILKIFRSPLKISMISSKEDKQEDKANKNGNIEFVVPVGQKLNKSDYSILFNSFVADFIGEIIVRENAGLFMNEFLKMTKNEYVNAVSTKKHKNFGMKLRNENLIFSFHISLLQDIFTEDIKKQII